jgi:hypothetical protein
MNPANNNPIAMTEAVATDDQLVAPVSLAAKLAGALVDDRLSAVVVVPCSRRVFSLRCPSADVPYLRSSAATWSATLRAGSVGAA